MTNEEKQAWIAALRSGSYLQGKGCLRRDDKFCCLGVLCEIRPNVVWNEPQKHYFFKDLGDIKTSILPEDVLNLPSQGILTSMNDIESKNFAEIADFLEKQPENFFQGRTEMFKKTSRDRQRKMPTSW